MLLLVEAESRDVAVVLKALRDVEDDSLRVERVSSCREALARLARDRVGDASGPEAITAMLVDLALPDSQGITTFERLHGAAPHVPILVLIEAAHEKLARLAVARGAQDYLLKQHLDSYLLPKTLRCMVDRATIADALFAEQERARVTLNSIGDAVISADLRGRVTYLNPVAESLTGWPVSLAIGQPVDTVFHIVEAATRARAPNPMALAIQANSIVGLTPHCVLIRRDGHEAAIEDSVALIHDREGGITGAVMIFRDVSTARALQLRMSHLAHHDGLTDLSNRLLFGDRLGQAIALAGRARHEVAVLFVDLDRFKHVNDALGHEIGDRLLVLVAQRLLGCVRGSDTVSRLGGDEFVILLAKVAHAEDAAVIARKVLAALSVPCRIDDHDLHLTASLGVATYPADGDTIDLLMKHADLAMYAAKEHGRNNFQFYNPAMNAGVREQQSLAGELGGALERRELAVHYQPIVDLPGGGIAAVEALVRWCHPRRGLLLPGQFLPLAEERGLMPDIGRWVLAEACRQAEAWRRAGLAPIRVSVNVSPGELRSKHYAAGVREVLAASGLAPGRLELELTETVLMRHEEAVRLVVTELKSLGVRLALDDFGTGFSSLTHLRRLPIDVVKIDRSFVQGVATVATDASIVAALIDLAAQLGLEVVAEGVETEEQVGFLRAHRCRLAQGYYFGEAVSAEQLAPRLTAEPAERASPRSVPRRSGRRSPAG